jgi:hypothetical protein
MINEPKTTQAHFDFRTIHKIRNRNVTMRIMGYANPKKGKRNWVFGLIKGAKYETPNASRQSTVKNRSQNL